MNPKETIKKNLERRSEFVDRVPFHEGIPMPTWVELSLIDICNRKCSFCPKADEKVAPDTFQKMSRKIIDEIHDQLLEINFDGTISLCGYGEPLLHKDISYIVKKLSNVSKVEVITNGDVLSPRKLQELYISNVSKVLVSMYDGPEQIQKFNDMKNTKFKDFFEAINPLISDYMEKKSINIIIEKKNIFIGKNTHDITNEILEIINLKFN